MSAPIPTVTGRPDAAAALAAVGRAFADPVRDAQRVFRALLEAMSRPGQVQALPAAALAGMQSPGLDVAQTAVLLTLLDAETTLWLDPDAAPRTDPAAAAYLRFHTGVRLLGDASSAGFAATHAAAADAALWSTLPHGTDESPQAGATLIVAVASLAHGHGIALEGPGIEHRQALQVEGIDPAFWRARRAMESVFPRGIDLILTCGDRIAALPRTTRIVSGA